MKYPKLLQKILVVTLVTLILVGCSTPEAIPTTIPPTITPIPTKTAVPTITLTPTTTAVPTIPSGDSKRTLMVNDLERSYLLHIPPGISNQQSLPMVFAFHGMGNTATVMKKMTDFDDVADQAKFLVVYPTGIDQTWNYGGGGTGAAGPGSVDELAFVQEILSDLNTIATIDPKRIYATGFSQGAALVYRLACDMSDIFAAIAPVSHPMDHGSCQPTQAVSVFHVHGLNDVIRAYSDGVEEGIATWARLNGCIDSAQVEELCPTYVDNIHTKLDTCTDSTQANSVIHTTYASCQAGSAVELYTMTSGRHLWPPNYEPSFSEMIWDFFSLHPKP